MLTRRSMFAVSGLAAFGAGTPLVAGNRRQLFIDRRFIAESRGVTLNVNPPPRRISVLTPERPWESSHVGGYLSVLEDEGLFKMWYYGVAKPGGPCLCFATSTDGISWVRPNLGRIAYQGRRDTNIVLSQFREGAVFLDPVAEPARRFKTLSAFGGSRPSALGTHRKGTLTLLASPNGLDWKEEVEVLPFFPDSQNNLFWDSRIGKYAAYLRGWNPLRVVVRAEIDRDAIMRPWPYRKSANPRYLWRVFPWGGDWPATISTELPTVLACDERDPEGSDVYTPNVNLYPWADDAYFAFPAMFRHTKPKGAEKVPVAGVLETQLAASRDGIRFERYDRRPYYPGGLSGDRDSHGSYTGLGMLRRGDEILMYYTGTTLDHGSAQEPEPNAVFLAAQRLDGFVSADAGLDGGEIVTPPLEFRGDQLRLNIDTGAMGTASVQLDSADGRTAHSEPVLANATNYLVRWRSGSPREFQGKPVRLRFSMRRARLFAFQFV
jgi:hypothetical protein